MTPPRLYRRLGWGCRVRSLVFLFGHVVRLRGFRPALLERLQWGACVHGPCMMVMLAIVGYEELVRNRRLLVDGLQRIWVQRRTGLANE